MERVKNRTPFPNDPALNYKNKNRKCQKIFRKSHEKKWENTEIETEGASQKSKKIKEKDIKEVRESENELKSIVEEWEESEKGQTKLEGTGNKILKKKLWGTCQININKYYWLANHKSNETN